MFSTIKSRELWPAGSQKLCENITGSSYFLERLMLERKLEVHHGCVNTVCWNDSGTLLLSGSDDQHLIVTDPFNGKIVSKVRSGHRSNIFCARFLPGSQDREVVSCSGSGDIYYTDLDRDEIHDVNRFGCHFGTTYKVLVVPNEASTFLSCGDDGTVRFFDLRVKTSCNRRNCEEDIVINLQNSVSSMAVDPVIPYQLAVGSADGVVRIYDRRMLKAREKGGNPKSLICVFQSPISKMEKRHFRITSLNYRPGSHDVLVNYSSENIYLFNTYDLETTQNYSFEFPKATPNKRPPIVEENTSPGSSNENDEMEEYLGFSAEERRGPSTLYRPIRRLRLRGDWSDTGPNARPENEGQAPTSMIMQRMSDLLTRMLNTHVNDSSTTTSRSQDNSPNRTDAVADSLQMAANELPLPSADANQTTTFSSTNPASLLNLRHRSRSEERSISSEGLVSPELSSQDSTALETIATGDKVVLAYCEKEEGSQSVRVCNETLVKKEIKETDSVESQEFSENSGVKLSHDIDSVGREGCSTDVPLEVDNLSQNIGESLLLCSVNKGSPGIQYGEESVHTNSNQICLDNSLSSNQDCNNEKLQNKDNGSSCEGKEINYSVNVCDNNIDNVNSEHNGSVLSEDKECLEQTTSSSIFSSSSTLYAANNSDSAILHIPSSLSASDSTFAIASHNPICLEGDNSNSTLINVSNLSSATSVFSSSESSVDSTTPFLTQTRELLFINRKESEKLDTNPSMPSTSSPIDQNVIRNNNEVKLQLQKHQQPKLQTESDKSTVSFKSSNSKDLNVNTTRASEEERCESFTKTDNHRFGESHSNHRSLDSVTEEDDPLKCEDVVENIEKHGNFDLETEISSGEKDVGERVKVDSDKRQTIFSSKNKDKNTKSFDSDCFERGGSKSYAGKGKGIGKSSQKLPAADQSIPEKGAINAPYNDEKMKFALSENADSKSIPEVGNEAGVKGENLQSGRTALLLSSQDNSGILGDVRNTTMGMEDRGTDNITTTFSAAKDRQKQTQSSGNQPVSLSSNTEDIAGTSSGMGFSASQSNRHRRVGHSLPPTGNFQLHSDDDDDDDDVEDNDDDTTRIRRGKQSKSHAARKIQELFRKRRHAKENAHLLNLPQPRVLMKYSGHRNCRTMIKESNFYGDNYVMSGSDCGRIFIWERLTGKLAMYLDADNHVVNCVQPNPHLPVIASSGIDYDIKLWSPIAEESQYDPDVAHMIVQRNELMLVETRDTITVPPSLMLRVLASLSHIRAGRNAAAQSQPANNDDNNDDEQPQQPPSGDE